MISTRRLTAQLVTAAVAIAAVAGLTPERLRAQTAARLPSIVVLATGGTIAGAAGTNVQAGYTSGQLGVDQLIAAVPEAKKLATLRGEQISNIGSQDMNDAVWLKLANRVNALAAMPDVDGIVITHGTDTIEETAYFLNLVVKSNKPVVMTAAMRPATALSADGPLNFFNAVAVAGSKEAAGKGVLVVINDWIHGAASLTKTSTTAVQTFMSPLSGLIGTVAYGKTEFYRDPIGKHTVGSEFSLAGVAASSWPTRTWTARSSTRRRRPARRGSSWPASATATSPVPPSSRSPRRRRKASSASGPRGSSRAA
jgi:L-asparaginase